MFSRNRFPLELTKSGIRRTMLPQKLFADYQM
nr:MAG TPA: hypothetical protein [Caudoviricetes sp.]